MTQCIECDKAVADELRKREARDAYERIHAALTRSGLPLDYRTGERRTGDLPGSVHHVLSMANMLGSGLRGVFLHGPAGTFKTSIAAAVLASHIRGGATGRYVLVPDLFADILASYRDDDVISRATLVDRCVSAPCLVLDDLGKEKASEHAAGVLFEILDGRYREARKGSWLIVTSNYDLDALCDRFPTREMADPIRRRIAELTISVPMGAK